MIDLDSLTSQFADAVAAVTEKADKKQRLNDDIDKLAEGAFVAFHDAVKSLPDALRAHRDKYARLVQSQHKAWRARFRRKRAAARPEDRKPLFEAQALLRAFRRGTVETWIGHDLDGIEESLDRIADGIPVKLTKGSAKSEEELADLLAGAVAEEKAIRDHQETDDDDQQEPKVPDELKYPPAPAAAEKA